MIDKLSTAKGKKLWDEKDLIEQKTNVGVSSTNAECDITGSIRNKNELTPSSDIIREKISGIYKIVNKVNGKYYVGSSADVYGKPHGRWQQHKNHLRHNLHYNKHLQRAWNNYKECNFNFILIETVPLTNLLNREQYYLDIAKMDKIKCYNQSFIAGRPEWTEEMKIRRSEQIRGKNNPNYGNNKLRGKNNPFYGRKHSAETRHKMSKNHFDVNGTHNSQYKSEKYIILNPSSGKIFYGTQYEFYNRFKELKLPGVSMLINGHIKSYKGWIMANRNLEYSR